MNTAKQMFYAADPPPTKIYIIGNMYSILAQRKW